MRQHLSTNGVAVSLNITDTRDQTAAGLQMIDRTDVAADTGTRDLRPLVLHIARNMGGGVATAIADYARSLPEVRHVLLCHEEKAFVVSGLEAVIEGRHELPFPALAAMTEIRRLARQLDPDIIHLHSSFAGLYGRLALPRRQLKKTIYTPHCYGFHRADLSRSARFAIWTAEAILTRRSGRIAACSPLELQAATTFPGSTVTYVPNKLPQLNIMQPDPGVAKPIRVVAVGRLCPQKDPGLFGAAATLFKDSRENVRFVWIGDGDPETRQILEDQGVEVTGWLSRERVLQEMSGASIYVHTAAWEGAPLTVLEAAAMDLPVLGRDTVALRSLGITALWRTPVQLAALIGSFPDGDAYLRAQQDLSYLRLEHSEEMQRVSLAQTYGVKLRTFLDLRDGAGTSRSRPSRLPPLQRSTTSEHEHDGSTSGHRA